MDGLLVIDKPAGPTSHDVVARVRRTTGERRVGHTGTLDPLASGVLPLVLGRATRLARFLSASDKMYHAVVQLGVATDTYDAEGAAIGARHSGPLPSRAEIDRELAAFRGSFLQQPPAFSAKKIQGERSHVLARANRRNEPLEPEPPAPLSPLAPVLVTAYSLEIVAVDAGAVTLQMTCSSGFYVRSLAHDLGVRLGVGAHLAALRRVRAGDLRIEQAVPLDAVERERELIERAIVPLSGMLLSLPALVLTAEAVRRSRHGQELDPGHALRLIDAHATHAGGAPNPAASGWFRLLDEQNALVGLAGPSRTPGLLHPSVVLM
jgi:tRNA pseudouridine55 synthase